MKKYYQYSILMTGILFSIYSFCMFLLIQEDNSNFYVEKSLEILGMVSEEEIDTEVFFRDAKDDNAIKRGILRLNKDGYKNIGIKKIKSSYQNYPLMIFCIIVLNLFILILIFLMFRHNQKLYLGIRRIRENIECSKIFKRYKKEYFHDEVLNDLSQTFADYSHEFENYLSKFHSEINNRKIYSENVFHQLKTPLSSSILLLELSAGNIKEVKIVIKSLDNMNIMINQLLKTSLILSGGITFKFELISIKNTLIDALSELQIYFKHSQIKLEIEDSKSYSLYHDKLWMKEAFKNIIVNALETLIDENCIHIHLRKKGEQYVFVIHNSGTEIKESDMEKIFIRYKTSSEFTENHYGIGLNLSSIIVKNHFGDIDVASNHDGVRFRILLPIIAEENKFNFE